MQHQCPGGGSAKALHTPMAQPTNTTPTNDHRLSFMVFLRGWKRNSAPDQVTTVVSFFGASER